jgi:hypothetical protein
MLAFEKAWRFQSPGAIPDEVRWAFAEFINRVAGQSGNQKHVIEHFKRRFSAAAGRDYVNSSSLDWAHGDLRTAMEEAQGNAALFIEAFYDAVTDLARERPELGLPEISHINKVLWENNVPYEVSPPDLISRNPQTPIPVEASAPSFAQQARTTIFASLEDMDLLLAESRDRPAVQEGLWLLESIVHAFQGLETDGGTVQGAYFNKIVEDLSRHHQGQVLQQALKWATQLHGYLSSPTGGGVRHGRDLRADLAMTPQEARLYCNLIRSYISYLIAEHERLSPKATPGQDGSRDIPRWLGR